MTRVLPINLTYDQAKLVAQAFAMSDEEFVGRAVDREIKERTALMYRFDKLIDAHQKASASERIAAEVNR